MSRPVLRFDKVTKWFATTGGGPFEVLSGIDLEVAAGEAMALVGKNGSGKSTLLRLAAGITAPSGGTVERTARAVTVMELTAALSPDLTGRENLDLGLALHGVGSAQRRRVRDDVVEFADIGQAIDSPVKHYSDGMRARLALSMALHADAELLLIDEVLAVGDYRFQRRAVERAAALVEHGAALVLVTHDPYLALAACSSAAWLDGGVIAQRGRAAAVIADYTVSQGAVRRPAPTRHTRLSDVHVAPSSVGPHVPVTVSASIDRDLAAPATSIVVELLPPVGDEGWWMRGADQSPALRSFNVVGATRAMSLGHLPPGRTSVEVRFDRLPVTPPRAELALSLFDDDGSVVDEATVELSMDGPALDTPLLLEVQVSDVGWTGP